MLCHLGKGVSRNPSFPFLGLLAPLAFRTLAACTHTWGEEDFESVARGILTLKLCKLLY